MLIFDKLLEKFQTVLQPKILYYLKMLDTLEKYVEKNVLFDNDLVKIIISNEVLGIPGDYL